MSSFGGPEFNIAWGYLAITAWHYRPHREVIPSLLAKKDLSEKYVSSVSKGTTGDLSKKEIKDNILRVLATSLSWHLLTIVNGESNIGLTAICPGMSGREK